MVRRSALFATSLTWPHYQYGFKASLSGATCRLALDPAKLLKPDGLRAAPT
jgi:hypothetical protein